MSAVTTFDLIFTAVGMWSPSAKVAYDRVDCSMHLRSAPRHAVGVLPSLQREWRPQLPTLTSKDRAERHLVCCEAASSSGRPFEDLASSAMSGAQRAGSAAFKTMKSAVEVLDNGVRRTASLANAKFNISGKAQHAASIVSERAKVVDSKVGFKRRLRNLATDLHRKWPTWQKRYSQFSKTTLGQITAVAVIGFLLYTGLAFRILNFLFVLWWLTPFLLVPFTRYFNAKAEEELRRRAEEQQRARAARNPFFSSSFFSSGFRQGSSQSDTRNYSRPGSGGVGGGGPVIDVDYKPLDDK